MATITIHRWNDLEAGLREMRRVSRNQVVILTFDAAALEEFWLPEYVPEVIAIEQQRYPAIERIVRVLGGSTDVLGVPIPRDCSDGFGEAYYARPEAFLDADGRAAQSGWILADPAAIQRGLDKLAADLSCGVWGGRHGRLREQSERIGAVRLVVARPDSRSRAT